MKLPIGILNALKEKKILHPTPIQMQGTPAVYDELLISN
jgi:superfamily II DNA/RNA helicase